MADVEETTETVDEGEMVLRLRRADLEAICWLSQLLGVPEEGEIRVLPDEPRIIWHPVEDWGDDDRERITLFLGRGVPHIEIYCRDEFAERIIGRCEMQAWTWSSIVPTRSEDLAASLLGEAG
jgi:hypothetical protein